MNAESEAAEVIVRILGTGINETVKIAGTTVKGTVKGGFNLMLFLYALKKGGSPREIARNPAGMAIITIPSDKREAFVKMAKEYRLKHFMVDAKHYEPGYTDVCIKAEDATSANRILDLLGITALHATVGNVDEQEAEIVTAESFEQASERLKAYVIETPGEAFNRHTENDYSRDEPYVICARLRPDNYVVVDPKQAVFDGEPYTKSTYTCFSNNKQTGVYDDGRFEDRPDGYWYDVRSNIISASNIGKGDYLYFKTQALFEKYKNLYEGNANEKVVDINTDVFKTDNPSDLARGMMEVIQKEDIYKDVPAESPASTSRGENSNGNMKEQKVSRNGQKSGKAEKQTSTNNKVYDIYFDKNTQTWNIPKELYEDAERFSDFKEACERNEVLKDTDGMFEWVETHKFEYGGPGFGEHFYFADYQTPHSYIDGVSFLSRNEDGKFFIETEFVIYEKDERKHVVIDKGGDSREKIKEKISNEKRLIRFSSRSSLEECQDLEKARNLVNVFSRANAGVKGYVNNYKIEHANELKEVKIPKMKGQAKT